MKRIVITWTLTLAAACVVTAELGTKPAPANPPGKPAGATDRGVSSAAANPASAATPLTASGSDTNAPASFAAGAILYIDPNTGWAGQPPADFFVPLGTNNAFSTSTQGLQETPSPIQAGGMLLDLKGRFQHALVVTSGSDGRCATACAQAFPVSEATNSTAGSQDHCRH